jgi:outer membrane protein TolC
VSSLRDTMAARVERAEGRLDELRRERQACERSYRAARAALESLLSARAPELPPVPVPLAPARVRPILAWACVGGLLAVSVLLLLTRSW